MALQQCHGGVGVLWWHRQLTLSAGSGGCAECCWRCSPRRPHPTRNLVAIVAVDADADGGPSWRCGLCSCVPLLTGFAVIGLVIDLLFARTRAGKLVVALARMVVSAWSGRCRGDHSCINDGDDVYNHHGHGEACTQMVVEVMVARSWNWIWPVIVVGITSHCCAAAARCLQGSSPEKMPNPLPGGAACCAGCGKQQWSGWWAHDDAAGCTVTMQDKDSELSPPAAMGGLHSRALLSRAGSPS